MRCVRPAARVFSPLDKELALLPGEVSATLAEGLVRLGTWMPFAQAAEQLAFFWHVAVDETTVRRHTEAAGAAYVAEQAAEVEQLERQRPLPPPGPAVQYLSADGAMVPLRHGQWAEVKTLARGRVEQRRGADGASETHTTELSYFSRLAEAETFTQQAYGEAYRRGTESAGVVCAVQDGAEWLQGLVEVLRPDAVRILDFPHAVEHLSAAAAPVLGVGTPALQAWLGQQAHTLKHAPDGARQVLAALARLPIQHAADAPLAAQARAAAVRRVPGSRLPHRERQYRERQQGGGRGAAQREQHALGARARQPARSAADGRLYRPLDGRLAAHQRAAADRG